MKLEVIKDCYYVSDGRALDNEYLDKEELFNMVSHLLVVGDIWETDKDNPEYLVCVSGEWEGELNDGWWEYKRLKDYFKEI
jgi:hypothetical protein